jgi:hypothetical protein
VSDEIVRTEHAMSGGRERRLGPAFQVSRFSETLAPSGFFERRETKNEQWRSAVARSKPFNEFAERKQ